IWGSIADSNIFFFDPQMTGFSQIAGGLQSVFTSTPSKTGGMKRRSPVPLFWTRSPNQRCLPFLCCLLFIPSPFFVTSYCFTPGYGQTVSRVRDNRSEEHTS